MTKMLLSSLKGTRAMQATHWVQGGGRPGKSEECWRIVKWRKLCQLEGQEMMEPNGSTHLWLSPRLHGIILMAAAVSM